MMMVLCSLAEPPRLSGTVFWEKATDMKEAAIVATARTPIGKAHRGALNNIHGASLAGHVIAAAVARAGLEPAEIEDVLLGSARCEGAVGSNIARQAALRAGLPITTCGVTLDRKCASGLQTIAFAAQRIRAGECGIYVAGGVETVSLVDPHRNKFHTQDEWLLEHKREIYMAMNFTGDRPCAAGRKAPRRAQRRGHDVHWRRHGRGRLV